MLVAGRRGLLRASRPVACGMSRATRTQPARYPPTWRGHHHLFRLQQARPGQLWDALGCVHVRARQLRHLWTRSHRMIRMSYGRARRRPNKGHNTGPAAPFRAVGIHRKLPVEPRRSVLCAHAAREGDGAHAAREQSSPVMALQEILVTLFGHGPAIERLTASSDWSKPDAAAEAFSVS